MSVSVVAGPRFGPICVLLARNGLVFGIGGFEFQDWNLPAQVTHREKVVLAPKRETQLFGSDSLLPASGSLIANKFSLFRRLGNSVGKGLNFLPKAEVPWLFQARNRRISLYFPVEQGTNGRRPVR